jgi:hypothetical protein
LACQGSRSRKQSQPSDRGCAAGQTRGDRLTHGCPIPIFDMNSEESGSLRGQELLSSNGRAHLRALPGPNADQRVQVEARLFISKHQVKEEV